MRVAIFIVFVICVSWSNASREVVKTITVDNGGEWGWFRNIEFCPEGIVIYFIKNTE
jgi:IS30 family transposase